MPVEQLLPGLWRVGGDTWNGTARALSAEGDANAYLLRPDGAGVLIDCGTLAGRGHVEANLRDAGQAPAELTGLLLTHSHYDHAQAASEWQERYHLPTHLNATGAAFLGRGDHRLVGHHVHGPAYAFSPFAVDHEVSEGETFELGGLAVTAHFLPGHTPDSTLYTFEHEGVRVGICGDIAFGPTSDGAAVIGLLSILWLSDLDRYLESLRQLAGTPIDLLVPGHGEPVVGRERVSEAIAASLAIVSELAGNAMVRSNLGV
jgi:metallo-beta-lactamase class B